MKQTLPVLWLIAALALISSSCSPYSSVEGAEVVYLFRDGFTDTSGGWESGETEDGSTGYYNGAYRIFVNQPDYYLWSNPRDLIFIDVRIEVDATKMAGPDINDIGVICRYQNPSNFYFFSISSDGYYAINKFIDGKEEWIGMEAPIMDNVTIRTGTATNHLRADCIQQKLSFYVNGIHLIDVIDSDLSQGNVGLIAGTWDTPGTDVLFDNFLVIQP
jgi:hypothetical protein